MQTANEWIRSNPKIPRNPDRIRIVLPDGNGRNYLPDDRLFANQLALKVGDLLTADKNYFNGYRVYDVHENQLHDGLIRYVFVN